MAWAGIGREEQDETCFVYRVTGQAGSYRAQLLLEKGYEVPGIYRRVSTLHTTQVDHVHEDPHAAAGQFAPFFGDSTDSSNLLPIVHQVQPDEVDNIGARSDVAVSFEAPEYTTDVDSVATLRLLEAIEFRCWSGGRGVTKLRRGSCTGCCMRRRSGRRRRFTCGARMRWPSCMCIESR